MRQEQFRHMDHRDPMRGQRAMGLGQQGLTLLEVLITLVILALMGVIVVEAFRVGQRSWERGEKRAEAAQRIRVMYGMLAQELASLQPVTAKVDGKRLMAFVGKTDRVFFYSAPNVFGSFPSHGMVRGLSFFVEREKGLVVQESYLLVAGAVSLDPGGPVTVVDPHVTRIKFRYLVPPTPGDNRPRWVEVWDPREFLASPAGTTDQQQRHTGGSRSLPLAVEAQVAITDERGERELNFVFPIHVTHGLTPVHL